MRSTTMLPEGVIVPMVLRCVRYRVRGSVSGMVAHQLGAMTDAPAPPVHRPAALVILPHQHHWLAIRHW